jgi:acetoin utilization protein AcuB
MTHDSLSRPALEIEQYMSSVALTVSPEQSMAEAIRLMRLHEIRHLPVLKNGRVVGMLSQRDIYLMQSFDHAQPATVPIEEVMTTDPYMVEPETPVDHVAREMARRKLGSAIVARGERLCGLFTSTDALLALAAVVEAGRSPDVD